MRSTLSADDTQDVGNPAKLAAMTEDASEGSSRRGLLAVGVVGLVAIALVTGFVQWNRPDAYRTLEVPWSAVALDPDGHTLVFQTFGSSSCAPDTVTLEGDPTKDAVVVATAQRRIRAEAFCTADLARNEPVRVTLDEAVTPGLVLTDGAASSCGHSQVIEDPPPVRSVSASPLC